jgi:phosphate:Na+ symporter
MGNFFDTIYQILQIIGSLGLFIFGMKLMSEGIQKVAGNKLRQTLRGITSNKFKGIMTGIFTTSLVQSSSASTVMVISFVNAGLLTLVESFGVIMGANIGTTLTAWVVNYVGIKVKIAPIAIMLIGIALPMLFAKRDRIKNLAEFIMGFGILFIGLDFLKQNVPDLGANPEILEFLNQWTNLGFLSTIIFIGVGALLTVIIQSSSAATALTLLMLAEGWIGFPMAAAMVLGENMGTTITANLAALVANVHAKRAARFHFLFNAAGVIWMLIAMNFVVGMIEKIPFDKEDTIAVSTLQVSTYISEKHDISQDQLRTIQGQITSEGLMHDQIVVIADQKNKGQFKLISGYEYFKAAKSSGLVNIPVTVDAPNDRLPVFHSLFNVVNVLLLMWFTPLFARLVIKMVPTKGDLDDEFRLQYIGSGILQTPELSIAEAKKETQQFAKLIQKMCGNVMILFFKKPKNYEKLIAKIRRREEITDNMEVEIANFLAKVSEKDVSEEGSQRIQSLLRMINDMERIGDLFYQLSIADERMKNEKMEFPEDIKNEVQKIYDLIYEIFKQLNENMEKGYGEISLHEVYKKEEEVNALRDTLQRLIFASTEKGKIGVMQSITFLNIVNSAEKIGDHIVNINEALAGKK